MRVYLVIQTENPIESTYKVKGVFSSREKAQEYIGAKNNKPWKKMLLIHEWIIDE